VHYQGFPLVTRDLVAAAHRLGIHVHVWTINDPFLMERLLDAGVDGIITDNVTALRRILVDRGLWPATSTS
jgi:glycerophosphoryl diester phosphodiesterase